MKQKKPYLKSNFAGKAAVFGFLAVILVVALLPNVLYAQDPPPNDTGGLVPCGGEGNPCQIKHLVILVIRIINLLLGFSWLVAIFFVFWGGYSMIMAWGNPQKIEEGKKIISNAVIGFFLILISFILVNWLVYTLGGYDLNMESGNSIFKFIPFVTSE